MLNFHFVFLSVLNFSLNNTHTTSKLTNNKKGIPGSNKFHETGKLNLIEMIVSKEMDLKVLYIFDHFYGNYRNGMVAFQITYVSMIKISALGRQNITCVH